MQMGRENGGGYNCNYTLLDQDFAVMETSSKQQSPCSVLSNGAEPGRAVGAGSVHIEHKVSKFDTLAGVAIKYGVEVSDIKRMNGLVTDLQMFALESLQIPLPGRHPPSPCLTTDFDAHRQNSCEHTPPPVGRHSDLFESLQSLKLKPTPERKVSSAMSKLQGYYGLRPNYHKDVTGGCEMAIYSKGGAHYFDDGTMFNQPPLASRPLSLHRKSRSLADGLSEKGLMDNDVSSAQVRENEPERWIEKLKMHQKPENGSRTPEMLLKEDNSSGGFSAAAGKGLALRPKAASRMISTADSEVGPAGEFVAVDVNIGVKKSSSHPSLRDTDSNSSSIWPTSKWSLTADLQQAFSSAAITRPIFDGLPKPITGRKNKAALD